MPTLLRTTRNHAFKVAVTASLALACSMQSHPVKAGWPVMDYTAILNALQNYSEQIDRWQETARHYTKQADHWKTQLNNLRHLNFALFSVKHDFQEVEIDFGVDVECPGPITSGDIRSVLDVAVDKLRPNMGGDILQQQRDICAQIVQAKNEKYNDTVRYLKFVQIKLKELEVAQRELIPAVGASSGNTLGYTAQLTEFESTMNGLRAQWESNLSQSDKHIDMLLTMQANLSRRAMNGSPSLLGTVVNTAALKAAFQ